MQLLLGDCLEQMKTLPDNSVDAIVTDPPYGLSFMGKKWDYDVPSQEIWEEALRVLKPGGYLLSFAGTRTQHRMAVRIEDAGFEIRDMIAWVYGSGFPKSLNIGKAVDKIQGNEREKVGETVSGKILRSNGENERPYRQGQDRITSNITKGTSEWEGWGTALKPALEPITVARKPLSESTVAHNVLKWGVGGIDIDGSRVGTEVRENPQYGNGGDLLAISKGGEQKWDGTKETVSGRFPANLIWSCDCDKDLQERINRLDGFIKSNEGSYKIGIEEWNKIIDWKKDLEIKIEQNFHFDDCEVVGLFPNDSARFFYCPKSSKAERNRGCEGMQEKQTVGGGGGIGDYLEDVNSASGKFGSEKAPSKNNHPTVKPIALMEYLVKLVSREGAVVLDPFMGSGSTGIACRNLKRDFIGIELDPEYMKIAEARINSTHQEMMF